MKAWTDMTPRERDAAIAERVMGWSAVDVERERTHDGSTYFSPSADSDGGLPHYTTEHDAARLVEDEIERRGRLVQDRYVAALILILNPNEGQYHAVHFWSLLRSTPEQRCEAAWRACGQGED